MIQRGLKRARKGAKRVDMAELREALRDRRVWTLFGTVTEPEGPGSHYRLVQEGGKTVDVLVEVETAPTVQDLTCRLSAWAGGPGAGLWRVPAPGSEVVVAMPEGRLDMMPTIIGVLSSGDAGSERISDQRTVIVASDRIEITAPAVFINDDGTGGVELAKKSDVDDLANYVQGHLHDGVTTGTGTSGTPTTTVPSADGTHILRAK